MTKHSETEDFAILDELAEKFAMQHREGLVQSVDEFVAKYPQWESQLREILPVIPLLENTPRVPISGIDSVTSFPNIDGYRFVRELGRGGMGIVYQAEHTALGRQVAVKILSSQLVRDEKARSRFLREARAAARMHHSNIVPVFEVGQNATTTFYSMQLISGSNLDEQIKEIKRSRSSAQSNQGVASEEHYQNVAVLGVSISSALQYAHDRKVLHRDIKPSNVLFDETQTAWLGDFGLASISDEQVANTEELVGTLRYLAPERLEGKCDERSDVYSLGLTLYEYATLRPAFNSQRRTELLNPRRMHLPARKVDPGIPIDLATIIEKAVMPDPDFRIQTAAELANELQSFLDGKPITSRPVSPLEKLWMWRKRNPSLANMALTINLLLLAIALGSFFAATRFNWLNVQANKAKSLAIEQQRVAETNATEAEKQTILARQNERAANHVSQLLSRMVQGADPSGLFTGHERSLDPIDQSTTAFEWILRSAKLLETEDFTDSPLVEAQIKDTLGVALTGQMRMNEASPLLHRSLKIRRQLLDPDHPDLATSINHLGTFQFYRGDSKSASILFREALAIRERRLSQSLENKTADKDSIRDARLSVTRTQAALGLALAYSMDRWHEEAIQLLRTSLAGRIELLGDNHYEVAYSHIALASILARSLQAQESLEHVQAAEGILAKQGGDHRLTEVFSLYAQGTALQAARQTDLAVDRFVKAEARMNEIFGPSHPLTVYARGEVAGALERGGRPEQAEEIYKRVIKFNEQAMANQPFLGQSWETLGICLSGQGKHAESIDAYQKALDVYGKSGIADHHTLVLKCKLRLGLSLTGAGRPHEAFETLKSTVLAMEKCPRQEVGSEMGQGLTHMAYLTMWHQYDRFPEVIEIVVRVGKDETDPARLFHLLEAGTRGLGTKEQSGVLLDMNDRWIEKPLHEYDSIEARHFRARVLYLNGRYDEALELLEKPHPNEARRFQATLFRNLCNARKGNLEIAQKSTAAEIEWLLPRIPEPMGDYLQKLVGDPISSEKRQREPEIQFPWDQSAYAEFAWRLLNMEKD